jgi:asparagine synthase (glutamine-hydrolysing)
MCGIAGIIGSLSSELNIKKMINKIKYRGPDNLSFINRQNIFSLGFARLKIIDTLDRSNQPFYSKCRNYCIIFNGEIYNYKEISKKLNNVKLNTLSDTEVLLESYIKWGAECLKKFEGMYSFAIWDNFKNKLFCAVDCFGIKPFYYTKFKDSFIFASEISALLEFDLPKKINDKIVYDFLAYAQNDHTDETFFLNIKKLPAASYFFLDLNCSDPKIFKYWDLSNNYKTNFSRNQSDREEELSNLFKEIIEISSNSDVPSAIALSGGIDSALILNNLTQKSKRIDTFSFIFKNKKYSELSNIKNTIDQNKKIFKSKIRNSFITIEKEDFFKGQNLMLEQQQEPHAGLPIYAYSSLAKVAKEKGIKVLFDGTGLDELFMGYDFLRYCYQMDLKKNNDNFAQFQDNTTVNNLDLLEKKINIYKNINVKSKKKFNSLYKNETYKMITSSKLPRSLRYRDRLSMHNSIELRPIFLNKKLFEFAFAMPEKDKIFNNQTKYILRKIGKKYLHKNILRQGKQHIQTPSREWTSEMFNKRVEKLCLYDYGIINKKKLINKYIKNPMGGGVNNNFFLYQCLVLDDWIKKYI